MAVAPSYQKFSTIGEPFEENKKLYIYVDTLKGQKKVRWYPKPEDYRINAHQVFGFGQDNYINLIIGTQKDILKWKDNLPPYTIFDNTIFGWYMPSTVSNIVVPSNIQLKKVTWEEVRDKTDSTNTMINQSEVREYIKKIR